MVPYAAAKGAVVAMILPMARDLASLGVRVCAIAPSGFVTPRLASRAAQQMLMHDVVFPQRLGHPDDYALLVESIIRNPYLNGEVIRLDGATRLSKELPGALSGSVGPEPRLSSTGSSSPLTSSPTSTRSG
jgi:NAD(P)-dependent dehydrogenase (short-subunit alcohol dehydrogenase family)